MSTIYCQNQIFLILLSQRQTGVKGNVYERLGKVECYKGRSK